MKKSLLTRVYCFAGIIAYSLMFLSVLSASAQEQVGLRERAEELYGRFEYANAAALYAKLADS
ncbi:hypothetical protein ACFOET_00025, partial [Parapedobacter deserti]